MSAGLDLARVTIDMIARRRTGESGDESLPNRVRAVLLSRLGGVRTSEEQVARALRMSSRTLQRRLRAQGTSYRRLLAGALRSRAEFELANSPLTVAEIAARLGFTDPANFSRAFRRWTGRSPHAYRRSLAQSDRSSKRLRLRQNNRSSGTSPRTARKGTRVVRG